MISLLLNAAAKRSLQSIYTDLDTSFSDISFGEKIPTQVALVDPISSQPPGNQLWLPSDITGWTIRAAIGNSFRPPVAGSFTLTYTAPDTTTETTAPIAFNASAADVQGALNAGGKMTTAGGVTVTGTGGYFFVTFNVAASQAQIVGDSSNLAPTSVIEAGTLINGSGALKDVQTLRLLQQPAAYAVLATNSPPAAAPVTVLQVGDGSHNHKVRVRLDPLPYDGKWTITVGGDETDFLGVTAISDDVKVALEALGSVGVGNVQVTRLSVGNYIIMFRGTKAHTDMGVIVTDVTALSVISYKIGALETNTAAMEILLGMSASVNCFFEVEGTDPDGVRQKLLKVPVKVVAPIINSNPGESSPFVHFYTSAEVDALLAAKQPLDGTLTALAGLTVAANKGLYATGADAFSTFDLTAFGRTFGGYANSATAKAGLAIVVADVTGAAPLASPTFTGAPLAPTAGGGNNTTQLATTAFVQQEIATGVATTWKVKGNIDCSANPNYPAATVGDTYKVSVAGRIGGGSGIVVEVGDTLTCVATAASGNQATVGTSWNITQANITGQTTVGMNLLTLANPGAISFLRINADNSVTARSAANLLSDIGAQAQGVALDNIILCFSFNSDYSFNVATGGGTVGWDSDGNMAVPDLNVGASTHRLNVDASAYLAYGALSVAADGTLTFSGPTAILDNTGQLDVAAGMGCAGGGISSNGLFTQALLTVAALGAAAGGRWATVNDALLPVIGMPVVGGGSAVALVWANGINFIVVAK